jgi:hypothetical protein
MNLTVTRRDSLLRWQHLTGDGLQVSPFYDPREFREKKTITSFDVCPLPLVPRRDGHHSVCGRIGCNGEKLLAQKRPDLAGKQTTASCLATARTGSRELGLVHSSPRFGVGGDGHYMDANVMVDTRDTSHCI